jgi:hypothetical protein
VLTKNERAQAVKFQDAIGEIVDVYLREGMSPEVIAEVLRDEADQARGRQLDLEADSELPKMRNAGWYVCDRDVADDGSYEPMDGDVPIPSTREIER